MTPDHTWHMGQPNALLDRIYDHLRSSVNRRLVRFLSRHLVRRTHRPCTLEAGCGTALASSILGRDQNAAAVCIDHDVRPLQLARTRDPSLLAVVADATRLPFCDDAIDLVFSSSTLEHLPDPRAAVAEMRRVCRTAGHVFVGVPYRFGPLAFQPWIASTAIGQWLGPVFSHRKLRTLLVAAGLTPVARLVYFCRFFVGIVAVKRAGIVPT